MKKFFFVLVMCLSIVSCKRDERDYLLDADEDTGIVALICLPHQPEKYRPLYIVRTAEGWRVYYGGSESICYEKLRITSHTYGDGQEALAFEEYMDGKEKGQYYFKEAIGAEETESILCYQKTNSKRIVHFHCTKIYDKSKVNVRRGMRKDKSRYLKWLHECHHGTLKALRNPHQTLKKGVPIHNKNCTIQSIASPDGKVRINIMGYNPQKETDERVSIFIILQFDNGVGITTLSNFATSYFSYLQINVNVEFSLRQIGEFHIYQVQKKNKNYYLIASNRWEDTQRWTGVVAYQIRDGKLIPAPIFNGKCGKYVVYDGPNDAVQVRFDKGDGHILVPKEDNGHVFTGEYDTIQSNDQQPLNNKTKNEFKNGIVQAPKDQKNSSENIAGKIKKKIEQVFDSGERSGKNKPSGKVKQDNNDTKHNIKTTDFKISHIIERIVKAIGSGSVDGESAIWITVLAILLVSFIAAVIGSRYGGVVFVANWIDWALVIGAAILYFISLLIGTEDNLSQPQVTLMVISGIMMIISLVLSVIYNLGNILNILISILAKIFLFVLTNFMLVVIVAIAFIYMMSIASSSNDRRREDYD